MYFFNFSILHKLHEIRYFRNFRDRMPCYDFKSLHQHPVLVICDGHCFICRPWPPERTVIQSFVHEKETIAFPQKGLDPAVFSSAEQKKCIFIIRVKFKLKADNRSQSIDPPAEIRISTLSLCVDNPDYKHEIFILIFCKKH